jgi:hypothetical protein
MQYSKPLSVAVQDDSRHAIHAVGRRMTARVHVFRSPIEILLEPDFPPSPGYVPFFVSIVDPDGFL